MYLRGKRYETEKKIAGGDRKSASFLKSNPDNQELKNNTNTMYTSARIAKEYGVGHDTIERDFRFAKAVDAMPSNTKEKILSGEEKVSKNDMMEFAMNFLTFISKTIIMDLRENLVIITTKEELQKLIDEAVSKAIAGLNLRQEAKEETTLIYGIEGLAKLLNCSRPTAQRIKSSRQIPCYQQGRTLVFKSDEVLNAMAKKKRK